MKFCFRRGNTERKEVEQHQRLPKQTFPNLRSKIHLLFREREL